MMVFWNSVKYSLRWFLLYVLFCLASLILFALYGWCLHLLNWDQYLFLPAGGSNFIIMFVGFFLWLGFSFWFLPKMIEGLDLKRRTK